MASASGADLGNHGGVIGHGGQRLALAGEDQSGPVGLELGFVLAGDSGVELVLGRGPVLDVDAFERLVLTQEDVGYIGLGRRGAGAGIDDHGDFRLGQRGAAQQSESTKQLVHSGSP